MAFQPHGGPQMPVLGPALCLQGRDWVMRRRDSHLPLGGQRSVEWGRQTRKAVDLQEEVIHQRELS